METELGYDDVLILPAGESDVNSRSEVNLTQGIDKDFVLKIPIIGSPMKGIMGVELAQALSKLGGLGILHRFYKNLSLWEDDVKSMSGHNYGVAVGLEGDYEYNFALDHNAKIILVDVANGHLKSVQDRVEEIKNYISNHNYNSYIMAGNVVTYDATVNLWRSGADFIRVGIGGGRTCSTRNVTGIGRPDISAIMNCSLSEAYIVADGGIRNSGDMVKALCAGADFTMVGSLLAKTFESENDGLIYGMASKKLQEDYYDSVKSIEGLEVSLSPTMDLNELINDVIWGIKSAFTYLGARDIQEAQANARFIRVLPGAIKDERYFSYR